MLGSPHSLNVLIEPTAANSKILDCAYALE